MIQFPKHRGNCPVLLYHTPFFISRKMICFHLYRKLVLIREKPPEEFSFGGSVLVEFCGILWYHSYAVFYISRQGTANNGRRLVYTSNEEVRPYADYFDIPRLWIDCYDQSKTLNRHLGQGDGSVLNCNS